jgi:hypothetical protein
MLVSIYHSTNIILANGHVIHHVLIGYMPFRSKNFNRHNDYREQKLSECRDSDLGYDITDSHFATKPTSTVTMRPIKQGLFLGGRGG